MLKIGGNAADAMVATSFCVGVVAMYHSGIGGGGFMLVRNQTGSFEFLDFRETAPALATVDKFSQAADNGPANAGLKSLVSGVPGELRGLEYLSRKYGALPWSTVMGPAVRLARDGFPVTRDLLRYMNYAIEEYGEDFLHSDPDWAVDFAPHGRRLRLGDTMTRKRYASALEKIASGGPDVFYSGPLGRQFVDTAAAAGGVMTTDDLRDYKVVVRNHSEIEYRGHRVITTTAPSSGIVIANILKVLNTYDDLFTPQNVNLSTHYLDEAMRFAYGLRTRLGDPDFVDGMEEYQDYMIQQSTADAIRRRILDTQTHNVSEYNPDGIESIDTPGTSHMASVDSSGLAISATTSINLLFGSRIIVPESGIILNNELDDFSRPNASKPFGRYPSRANFIAPGKRPFSSMSPSMVLRPDGSLLMLAGAAGGSFITTATTQNIIAAVDEGLSATEILAKPRLHDQLTPNHIIFETAYDNATVDFMRRLGHEVVFIPPIASMAHAILVSSDGRYDVAAEPRQQDSGGAIV
ncbi:gamma-glutamyltranspeptidase [Cordyceps fumosorosea ARSEF 2679]|uniref:Gamma-glutamyltranspeptidase n=1 Tax=Cordyceps fumosorosea (strain ARSEF 2679) TaxID=1081104 RepID=A0A168DGF5_CORFA|nr:gamma-glutamyltranspeptidase [Cordyceps fumosorosea ARSEF 2679]OAA72585.1 gamma-glutamyltranspeptidase [Cordyceps fumosorosea ARSEF 2679]